MIDPVVHMGDSPRTEVCDGQFWQATSAQGTARWPAVPPPYAVGLLLDPAWLLAPGT